MYKYGYCSSEIAPESWSQEDSATKLISLSSWLIFFDIIAYDSDPPEFELQSQTCLAHHTLQITHPELHGFRRSRHRFAEFDLLNEKS